MNQERLQKYAHLIAKTGANVQNGQEVFIYAELDQPAFVRMVAEECYLLGAKRVFVEWADQDLTVMHFKYRTEETLCEMTDFEEAKWQYQLEKLPCKIYLMSEDPDGMADVDQGKFMASQRAKMKIVKPIRDKMDNHYQWCIAAVPGEKWATKVFPGKSPADAIEALWEAILSTSRVNDDPIAAWDAHNKDLADRCAYLNDLGIKTMHYTASNGTDFTVTLMDESIFMAGGETTLEGIFFDANIPTEEVFTTPLAGAAEGIVYSSRPLSYNGQLIDNFSIRFEGVRAVEAHAEVNEELLRDMIGMDEGAARLGECALVPYHSPIRESEILFYNTLFDENAACHLALGRGFNNCVRGYENMTNEEMKALGVNDSMIHVDFMIGTADLSITATTKDGREVKVFENGDWAF